MTPGRSAGGIGPTGPLAPAGMVSARLAVLVEDRILLASRRGQDWFYLPGGMVRPGDTVDTTLRREIREETGLAADSFEFVGCVEDRPGDTDGHRYDLSIVFAADLPRRTQVFSRADTVDITSVALADLPTFDLRPAPLPALLTQWLNTRRAAFRGLPTT